MSLDTYLVIGGEGFVGRAILKDLRGRYGDSVKLYSSSRTQRFFNESWEFIPSDLTSAASLRSVLENTGAKTVFLAAASHFESSRADAFAVNVEGAKATVEACIQAGVRRLILTSSTAVIFKGEDLLDVTEEHPYPEEHEYRSYYALSKALGEKIVIHANGKDGLYTTAIRPSGIIGPGDTTVTPQTIDVMKKRQAFIQVGPNENLCDFDHVDNVSLGHILACEKLLNPDGTPGPAAGQVFHITAGEPMKMFDFLRREWWHYNGYEAWFNIVIPLWLGLVLGWLSEVLHACVGKKATGFNRDTMKYAVAARWHNIDKAKKLLGYMPIVSAEEGIRLAVQDYKLQEEASLAATTRTRKTL